MNLLTIILSIAGLIAMPNTLTSDVKIATKPPSNRIQVVEFNPNVTLLASSIRVAGNCNNTEGKSYGVAFHISVSNNFSILFPPSMNKMFGADSAVKDKRHICKLYRTKQRSYCDIIQIQDKYYSLCVGSTSHVDGILPSVVLDKPISPASLADGRFILY